MKGCSRNGTSFDGYFKAHNELDTFEKVTYFSVVPFTTLGYRDITLLESDTHTVLERIHGCLIEGPSPQPSPKGRGGKA